ncbi:hypothetical protein ACFO3I_05895 [Rheinheimera marina]|uniref:Uncharacterized protein n=1 Tax=Rheinheimera marina TaxID=1774958 RepID=A0ABV9JJY8_9GAMM
MSIYELTQKVKTAGQTRTHEQRIKLLKDAHVLDSKGRFDERFFRSSKTCDAQTSSDKT